MRDSFDHYFEGWTLETDGLDDPRAFSGLVDAVATWIRTRPEAAEAWRAFPLDGKRDCFLHFVRLAAEAGALDAPAMSVVARLKDAYPRSFAS